MPQAPKVFISHSSEDKGRFVMEFATRLRADGIDAWVDQWEISPGDSLITKIFDQGIKEADFFITLVSVNSVSKPWVKEELDSAVVKRISGNCKIIPIVIDECKVPFALQHLKWTRIKNISAYDSEYNSILNALHGLTEKPSLGEIRAGTRTNQFSFLIDFTKIDNLVAEIVCKIYLESGYLLVNYGGVRIEAENMGITKKELDDSLKILEESCLLTLHLSFAGIHSLTATHNLLHRYLSAIDSKHTDVIKTTASAIVNRDLTTNIQLAEQTGVDRIIVDHVLGYFETQGLLKLSKENGIFRQIYSISPKLGRLLQ